MLGSNTITHTDRGFSLVLDGYLMGFCLRGESARGAVCAGEVVSSSGAPAGCWRCAACRRACRLSMSCMKRAQASTFSQSEAGSVLSL